MDVSVEYAADINIGTITLMGQSIAVNSSTIMEDDTGDDQTFNLAEVLQGQYVNVDIYHDGNGWVAVKLERESVPEPLVHEIEGLVQEIDVNGDPDLIRVLDVLINMSLTGLNPIVGDRVEISGDYDISTLTLTATSGEID